MSEYDFYPGSERDDDLTQPDDRQHPETTASADIAEHVRLREQANARWAETAKEVLELRAENERLREYSLRVRAGLPEDRRACLFCAGTGQAKWEGMVGNDGTMDCEHCCGTGYDKMAEVRSQLAAANARADAAAADNAEILNIVRNACADASQIDADGVRKVSAWMQQQKFATGRPGAALLERHRAELDQLKREYELLQNRSLFNEQNVARELAERDALLREARQIIYYTVAHSPTHDHKKANLVIRIDAALNGGKEKES